MKVQANDFLYGAATLKLDLEGYNPKHIYRCGSALVCQQEDFDMFNSIPGWRFTYRALEKLRKGNHRVFVDYVEVD